MEEQIENNDLKSVITKNLVKYRKANKLTQIELAEKLQYSDKNISKWERGEALPDLVVLKQIADIYGISIEDLMTDSEQISEKPKEEILQQENLPQDSKKLRFFNKQQTLICSLSIGIVWLVATIVFVLLNIFAVSSAWPFWHLFIMAIPVSFVVMLVFSSIWCTNLFNGIVVSFLIWSVAIAFNVCVPIDNNWLIYILAIPLQILDILWFSLRKLNRITKNSAKKEQDSSQNLEKNKPLQEQDVVCAYEPDKLDKNE